MTSPTHITDEEFDAFVANHAVAVVDFWADWCRPCHVIAPVVDELAAKYDGKVAFGKVNTDEHQVKMRSFGIMGIPTLLVFKGGQLVDTVVGAVPKAVLEDKIRKHL